ncbi:MAG: hypothetical protein K2W96_03675 [Gemmataceae bacterium]|nr:hypothetical protein [Gemmataceae bacterium]
MDKAPEEREAAPRNSPQTDPTNPERQEAAGEWVAAERAAERKNDELGQTERDRAEREAARKGA